MTQSYVGTKQVLAWEQEKDGKPGYGVKYADGYVSWSPRDAFEQAYLAIGNVDDLAPHKQRLIGEMVQLRDKVQKLRSFLQGPIFQSLPSGERELLESQVEAMERYLSILCARVAPFQPTVASSTMSMLTEQHPLA